MTHDSEPGVDIHDVELDKPTDIDLEHVNEPTDIDLDHVNDGAMLGSSVEEESHLEQNDKITQDSSREELNVVEVELDEPYVGQEFESEEAAHAFYSAYGMRMGFITRMNDLSRSKHDGSIIGRTLVCNKEGYRKPYKCDKKSVKPRTSTRVGCKAMLSIRKLSTGKWVVTKFVKEHTHGLSSWNSQKGTITYQIPTENAKIQELTQQLLHEKKRSASLRKIVDLLFNHIEEHTQDLSKRVQYVVDKVKEIESEGKNNQNQR